MPLFYVLHKYRCFFTVTNVVCMISTSSCWLYHADPLEFFDSHHLSKPSPCSALFCTAGLLEWGCLLRGVEEIYNLMEEVAVIATMWLSTFWMGYLHHKWQSWHENASLGTWHTSYLAQFYFSLFWLHGLLLEPVFCWGALHTLQSWEIGVNQ